MKSVGKIAVLAMTLALAGVLSACGGSAASSSTAASSAAESSSAAAASAEAASSETASAEATSAEATSTETAASSEAAASEEKPDLYTNEAFGVVFTLPEGWTFATADEIAAQNAAAGAGEYGEVDEIATAPNGDSKVVIAIEDINDQNANQTAAEHAEGLIGEKTKESGAEISSTTINLPNGTQIPASKIIVPNPGDAPIYSVMASKKDDKLGYFDIVITAFSEEELEEVVSHFGNPNK